MGLPDEILEQASSRLWRLPTLHEYQSGDEPSRYCDRQAALATTPVGYSVSTLLSKHMALIQCWADVGSAS